MAFKINILKAFNTTFLSLLLWFQLFLNEWLDHLQTLSCTRLQNTHDSSNDHSLPPKGQHFWSYTKMPRTRRVGNSRGKLDPMGSRSRAHSTLDLSTLSLCLCLCLCLCLPPPLSPALSLCGSIEGQRRPPGLRWWRHCAQPDWPSLRWRTRPGPSGSWHPSACT